MLDLVASQCIPHRIHQLFIFVVFMRIREPVLQPGAQRVESLVRSAVTLLQRIELTAQLLKQVLQIMLAHSTSPRSRRSDAPTHTLTATDGTSIMRGGDR